MQFELTRDVEQFALRAEPFLAARLERNVLATVLVNLRSGSLPAGEALFATGTDDCGELGALALRRAPWPLLATGIDSDTAAGLLDAWLSEDPNPPSVNGQPETARAIAAAWTAKTGHPTTAGMRQAMHVLQDVVDPPRPAAGTLRHAQGRERDMLIDWMGAFSTETNVAGGGQAGEVIDAQLAREGLFVWEDGEPVSMVATSPTVAAVTRLGPVFTPVEFRRRGYASSAVAAVSQRALAAGADRCALFTDLTNPTSNKIYADVGYRRLSDWEEYLLHGSEG